MIFELKDQEKNIIDISENNRKTLVLVKENNTTAKTTNKVKTFCYHQIYKENEKCNSSVYTCIPYKNFESHLNYLKENNYLTLTMEELDNKNLVEAIKKMKELPILLLSGLDDPVGSKGSGVRKLENIYKKNGLDVTLKLYEGKRHDLFHETNKLEVFNDILNYIKKEL